MAKTKRAPKPKKTTCTIIYMTLKHLWAQIEGKSPKSAPGDGELITYFRGPYQNKVVDELLAPWRGPAMTGLGELLKAIKFETAQKMSVA